MAAHSNSMVVKTGQIRCGSLFLRIAGGCFILHVCFRGEITQEGSSYVCGAINFPVLNLGRTIHNLVQEIINLLPCFLAHFTICCHSPPFLPPKSQSLIRITHLHGNPGKILFLFYDPPPVSCKLKSRWRRLSARAAKCKAEFCKAAGIWARSVPVPSVI
jgi:hypothetical protein